MNIIYPNTYIPNFFVQMSSWFIKLFYDNMDKKNNKEKSIIDEGIPVSYVQDRRLCYHARSACLGNIICPKRQQC